MNEVASAVGTVETGTGDSRGVTEWDETIKASRIMWISVGA